MTINLQEYTVQVASRFFHERGMEPAIDMVNGELEFDKPPEMTEDEFSIMMSDMADVIERATAPYRTG